MKYYVSSFFISIIIFFTVFSMGIIDSVSKEKLTGEKSEVISISINENEINIDIDFMKFKSNYKIPIN